MYGKLFEQIYDSSVAENWKAMITLQQFVILADVAGVVDMTPEAISRRTNLPIDIIREGITDLEKPDRRSRNPQAEGRRIERLDAHRDWGWRIVNYAHYRMLASAEEKREADRKRIAAKRSAETPDKSKVSQPVAAGSEPSQQSPPVADVAHAEGEEEGEAQEGRHGPPSGPAAEFKGDRADWIIGQVSGIYPKREGSQRWPDAVKHVRAHLKAGAQPEEFIEGAKRYAAFCKAKGTIGTDKVQQAATFFGTNKGFAEPWEVLSAPNKKTDVQIAQEKFQQRLREARQSARNFKLRQQMAGEPDDSFIARIEREAAEANMERLRAG